MSSNFGRYLPTPHPASRAFSYGAYTYPLKKAIKEALHRVVTLMKTAKNFVNFF